MHWFWYNICAPNVVGRIHVPFSKLSSQPTKNTPNVGVFMISKSEMLIPKPFSDLQGDHPREWKCFVSSSLHAVSNPIFTASWLQPDVFFATSIYMVVDEVINLSFFKEKLTLTFPSEKWSYDVSLQIPAAPASVVSALQSDAANWPTRIRWRIFSHKMVPNFFPE